MKDEIEIEFSNGKILRLTTNEIIELRELFNNYNNPFMLYNENKLPKLKVLSNIELITKNNSTITFNLNNI